VKIYTKAGDNGETGLLGGDRIAKNSLRIHAIGEVDELNASLGVVAANLVEVSHRQAVEWIQNRLFDLGSELACPANGKFQIESITATQIQRLELEIDAFTDRLPPLKNFILPGGTIGASHVHMSRSVCRRAERAVTELNESEPLRGEPLQFLNRLSDWLFCFSRILNFEANLEDVIWQKEQ
jgi:cob(I)alamin adenosyltransferase